MFMPARLLAILAVTALVFTSLITFTPARAEVTCAVPSTQAQFLADPDCTTSSIVDVWKMPGPHPRLLTKEDLLRHADLYAHYGFSEEWIREAEQTTITVQSGVRWSGCRFGGTNAAGLCPAEAVTQAFMDDVIHVNKTIDVIGTQDKWIALMCGNFVVPQPPVEIDLEKVGFEVVNRPAEIPADTDVQITVRSRLRNNGPAGPVTGQDTARVTAHSPDCTVTPQVQTRQISLPVGQIIDWDASFTVRCAEPSQHGIVFSNTLTSPHGYYETNLGNQTANTPWNPAVLDKSDIAISEVTLDCADRTMISAEYACQAAATVTNHGPHGTKPENTRAIMELTLPEDCRILQSTGTTLDKPLAAGASVRQEASWALTCDKRSFHDMALSAKATLFNADIHVSDPNLANNSAQAAARTEVFENVDLETEVINLACTEREHTMQSSACTATVRISNNGPADKVITDTDIRFDVEDACSATAAQTQQRVLAAHSAQELQFTTSISCDTARRHTVSAYATLRNASSDPHAVDSDSDSLLWVPSDIKPRSLPSSINVRKAGLVPFAILGTAEFNPVTEVDIASLTFGVTGTETSVARCAAGGEDVNDDGYPDLVCQARTEATRITCGSTELVARGLLTDGRRFVSQDAVKTTGC